MASLWPKMILIAAILAITIPNSTCYRRRSRRSRRSDFSDTHDTEQNLRDLCSRTDRSDVCLNILKSEFHRFDNSDDRDIVDGVIDLATEKSKVIGDQLDQWFRDSNDDNLKEKYHSCSDNYNDVERNLQEMHRNLNSDDYRRIFDQINDAEEILNECKRKFESDSFDPGHVGDRNKELELYLDMIRAASDNL